MRRYLLLFGIFALLLAPSRGLADASTPSATGATACPVAADASWTKQETFVWNQACAGDQADFDTAPGYGGNLDPGQPQGLPANRILRSSFIATILLDEKYRHALTRLGLRIRGARFTETLNLANANLSNELWLDHSQLEKGADFSWLRSDSRITLDGTSVMGPLKINDMRVDGDLSMQGAKLADVILFDTQIGGPLVLDGAQVSGKFDASGSTSGGMLMQNSRFVDINLTGANIHGGLILSQSKVSGTLNMLDFQTDGSLTIQKSELGQIILGEASISNDLVFNGAKVDGLLNMTLLKVGGTLIMTGGSQFEEVQLIHAQLGDVLAVDYIPGISGGAEFSQLSLSDARISGDVVFAGSTVVKTTDMDALNVGGDLTMSGSSKFSEIDLLHAHIGGTLDLRTAKVSGALNCEAIQLGSYALLGGAEFGGPVTFKFGKAEELELAGATFRHDVDLTGMQILSDLDLGSPGNAAPNWVGSPELILTDASADAIQDTRDSWPARLDLNDFTYRSLSGHNGEAGDRMADRPTGWFKHWLASAAYSPQPYQQLAAVLRAEGKADTADDILYASDQNAARLDAWPKRAWMTALDLTVGYGYHIDRALFWVAGFVLAGAIVLRVSGEGRRHGLPFGIAYSFDLLLPIIQLRKLHYDIDLANWSRYYFYVHKIAGYVLGSFLVLGLSGIVKSQ
jgi:uncharacterized protein YjbI with pentapeptide repeats